MRYNFCQLRVGALSGAVGVGQQCTLPRGLSSSISFAPIVPWPFVGGGIVPVGSDAREGRDTYRVERSNGTHPLPPFPDGWYFIASSAQLGAEQLIQKKWLGQEIVAWRDRAGAVCVADAFCPHLGSHLGPAAGGVVRGGNLVCPFHGFEFDTTGRCAATPHAPPPKSARLKSYAVQEVNGFVFAYHDHQGRAPTWRIPEVAPDGSKRRVLTKRRLRAHPQATTENSVDFGHLRHIHGYSDLKQLSPTVIEGPFLTSFYSFHRHMLTPGLRAIHFSVEIKIRVCGLGVSMVEIHSPATGLQALQWMLATPIDGEQIDLWLAVDPQGPLRVSWLRLLPRWISSLIVPRILLRELVLDVKKDSPIWAHQRYEPRPVLSKGDQDIYRFRRYSAQFYPAQSWAGSGVATR